jgi:UDP-N-acetylglucosamine 2-epimerase
VTTEYGHRLDQMMATLQAISSIGDQALVFWPNVDAGGNEIASAIHHFRDEGVADHCHFIHNLQADDFLRLMAHCACMIGNSSAALREGGFLGTPAVSIGTRQHLRECGPNVAFSSYDPLDIATAVRRQLAHGRYQGSDLFGDGTAGRHIAEVLATVDPPVQKRLHYHPADLLEPVGDR